MIRRFFSVLCLLLVMSAKAQKSISSHITKEEAQPAIEFHNKARKEVGVAALTWSNELASFAQAWADNLVSGGCKLKHRPADGKWAQQYGENIFFASKPTATVLDASQAWYSEIKNFTYGKLNTNNWSKAGHYTQMVWRKTTQLGMGSAVCPSGAIIIVANYNPRGNFMGEKPY